MYLLIIIFKKSEFMAAQCARPILLNERFLVLLLVVVVVLSLLLFYYTLKTLCTSIIMHAKELNL